MNVHSRRGRRLSAWFAAAGCALWLLAQAVPADAQASRTRPGGSSSSSSSAPRGGGGSSASSGGSASTPSSGSGPVSVTRTRPSSGSSGSPTVIDKRRPRSPGRGGGGDFHGGYYWGPYRYGWWTGWSWWYPWGYGYPYSYPGYGYPPVIYPNQARPSLGALDTDVWPARTEVWINGQYVGFVDQFDGFPRYLWLEKGTYDVVFYLDGFKTLARQYTIYPGLVIDVEDRLEQGESIHPNDLAPTETPRRDARIREERERRAAAEEPEWRTRVRAEREAARDRPEESEPAPREAIGGDAWLYLRVSPPDAAVYLDGRFLGTARELSDRDTGISVTPGRHELSVVRPGYEDQRLEFDAEADGQVDLSVELEES